MFFLNQHFGDKGSADVDKHEGGRVVVGPCGSLKDFIILLY